MKTMWKKLMVAGLLAGLTAGFCPAAEMVLDRQGGWEVVQSDDGNAVTLFLVQKSDGTRTCLASVELPTTTVTNSYWDEYAGWDEAAGRPVGAMVTRVDTVGGEFRFSAFVNDGQVYWEDREDGTARLWTVPCGTPDGKTLLATGDAGDTLGASVFEAEPWNRGAVWKEAEADGGTMMVFENGTTTRLFVEAAVSARKNAGRKGGEAYTANHGYMYSGHWRPPSDGWQSEFRDRETVEIPDGVTKIGMGVFAGCTNLESVTIPDGVTAIGNGAFYGCSNLTSVAFPESVTSIGNEAFYGCSGLTNLVFPEKLSMVGRWAFCGCSGLTSVTIPGWVDVERGAFGGCSGLTAVHIHDLATWCKCWFGNSANPLYYAHHLYLNGEEVKDLVIPDGVTGIGWNSFSGCIGLTSVTIPDSVKEIGNRAFEGCSGLTSVAIGNGVTNIGHWAFRACSSLASFSVAVGNPQYASVNGLLLSKDGKTLVQGINGDVTIPNGVTNSVGDAFSGCSGLTSVVIPDSVTSIGSFSGYTNLVSVTIGNGVTNIGEAAFSGCYNLTNVTIGASVADIEYGAFSGCSGLLSVTMSDSVTDIGDWAFSDCSSLADVAIGAGVTNIGYGAFSGCSRLLSFSAVEGNPKYSSINGMLLSKDGTTLFQGVNGKVTIPDSVTSIAWEAFEGRNGVTSISTGNGLTSLYNLPLSSSLREIVIGNGVTDINPWEAFPGCTNLTSITVTEGNAQYSSANGLLLSKDGTTVLRGVNGNVTIPDGVTDIGYGAFEGCSGLTSVKIGSGVTNIEEWAFGYCSSLTCVTISASVTSIQRAAFRGCSNLTSVTIPDSVASIGVDAFSDCNNLTSMTILGNVTDDWSYPLFSNCPNLTTLVLSEKMTKIGNNMFFGCSGLTNITIPDSVTSIGDCAFSGCSGLTSVTIPASVMFLGGGVFSDCSGLTNIVVATGNPTYSSGNGLLLTKDGKTLIQGINGDVAIPDSVTSIEREAFSGCSGLTRVSIPDNVTRVGPSAFDNCSGVYDTNTLSGICLVDGWVVGWTDSLPATLNLAGIRGIVGEAFSSCSGLRSVTIPDGMTSIWENAFSGCSGLTNITIPNSVTSIGREAFSSCGGLTRVAIPTGVTSIGGGAFQRCNGLTSVMIPDSVTSIGSYAFGGCSNLISVAIGNGITSVGLYAFDGCYKLAEVYIHDLAAWCGISFDDGTGTTPLSFGGRLYLNGEELAGDLVIPYGVTGIGSGVFAACRGLTSVTIPESVTSIGNHAFAYCSGLTSVTIGNGVTSIGEWAFSGCSSLARVMIPDNVTSIGRWAFGGCSGLTSVTIGNGLTNIGFGVFEDCSGLKKLRVPSSWSWTSMLNSSMWGWSGKPSGCEVVYRKPLPEAGSEAEVAAALSGAADGRLGERIRSVGEYAAFRAWAAAKGLDAAAVLGSAHAWISYALGAEKLLGDEPEIVLGGVEAVRAEGSKGAGGASMVVEVTVRDGGKAVAVDAEKVAGLFECTGDLRDWPGAAMGVSVVRTGGEGASMRFEVAPAAGGAERAFLRVGVGGAP